MIEIRRTITFVSILLLTINLLYAQENKGIHPVRKGSKYVYEDQAGKSAFKGKFEHAKEFSEGLAAVKIDGKYGYIGLDGIIKIYPVYDDAWGFKNGKAKVMFKGEMITIDIKGNIPGFETINEFALKTEGISRIRENNKYGYIDANKKILFPIEFDSVTDFSNGLASICQNGKWGMVNKKGKIIVGFKYDQIFPYRDGFYMVLIKTEEGNKYNYINAVGDYLSDKWFDEAISFVNGNGYVDRGGKAYTISKKGEFEPIKDKVKIRTECSPVDLKTKSPEDSLKYFNDSIYLTTEQFPSFQGGESARNSYLVTAIRYPEDERNNGIQGQVIIAFVVDKNGLLKDIEILKGVSTNIDKEVIRVVSDMLPWIPGIQNGIPVCVRIVLPVRFTLN